VDFYYGSGAHTLWTMIEEINDISLSTVEERKEFLKSQNIAITDMIETCIRRNHTFLDKDIIQKSIDYKDTKKLLKENTQIDTLIYTSEFVVTLMSDYLHIKQEERNSLKIDGKTYNIIILTSPSPMAIKDKGENAEKERLEAYTAIFKK